MKDKSKNSNNFDLKPLGDSAIIIKFGEIISLEIHQRIKALAAYLDVHPLPGMIEALPTYTTITIFYDPFKLYSIKKDILPYEYLASLIEEIVDGTKKIEVDMPRILEIPVCYGEEFGPDLDYVAEYHCLSKEEVISIHSEGEYLVYMLGFAPGFPYLGGMSERIATPRKPSPRLTIPAGSVGIAGLQTGVYPSETPGGWQIIGRTPSPLFKPKDNSPSLIKMGDIIKFRPISPTEFENWEDG